MHGFDPAALDADATGRIVKSCVAPRPIAWISTVGEDGTPNLAPFSCYNYVSPAPPVVMFATGVAREEGLKDTPRNVLDTGEFAVNVTTEPFLESMDATSDPLPAGEDEFAHAGVEPADCETISAPRVAGAAACLECTLHDSMRVYDRLVVLGEVRRFLLAEELLTDGRVDAAKLPLLGRLGGPYYTDVSVLERTAHLMD